MWRMVHALCLQGVRLGADVEGGGGLRQVQKELGLALHPPRETFVDMARTLIALGIAKPVKA